MPTDPNKKPKNKETLYVDRNTIGGQRRYQAYQDSLALYNLYKDIPVNAFDFRRYVPTRTAALTNTINNLNNYSGDLDVFKEDKIKPYQEYSFIIDTDESYNNGVYYPAQRNVTATGFLYKKPTEPVEYERKQIDKLPYKGIPQYIPEQSLMIPPTNNQQFKAGYPDDQDWFEVSAKGKRYLRPKEGGSKEEWIELNDTGRQDITSPQFKYGGQMKAKYRKPIEVLEPYGDGGFWKKAGSLAMDGAKLVANTALTPIEHITGNNFFDPTYDSHAMSEISKVASGVSGLATDVAGTILAPGAYNMGKGAVQQFTADPNTFYEDPNNPTNSEKWGRGIAATGNLASLAAPFMGGQPEMRYGGYKKKLAMGGSMEPDLGLTQFEGGGTHEQNPLGGIPLNNGQSVEAGETKNNNQQYVYSDRLTIDKDLVNEFYLPKKFVGKTFAEASKLLEKDKDPNDVADATTNKRMLERLTEAQEAFKSTKMGELNTEAMKYGGYLALGGPLKNEPWTYVNPGDQLANDLMSMGLYQPPKSVSYSPPGNTQASFERRNANRSGVMPTTDVSPFENLNNSLSGMPGKPKLGNAEGVNPNPNLNVNPLLDYARLAPAAANLIQGLKKPDRLNPKDYQIAQRVSPGTYDIEPLLRDNVRTAAATQDAARSATMGNAGAYLANLSNIQASKGELDSKAHSVKQTQEGQWRMAADQANAGIEGQNAQMRFTVDDWNMASKAAREAMLSEAASNVGAYADSRLQDDLYLAYLSQMTDDFKPNITRKVRGIGG